MVVKTDGSFAALITKFPLYPCPEPRHRACALPECALPRRQQDAGDQLGGALGREEGVDQGGARVPAQAHV